MESNVEIQKTEIDTFVEQVGLEKTTQSMLIASFVPFLQRVQQWKKDAEALVVTDASQTGKMKMAREARLELKRIRNEADRTRKMLKEDSLRYGKAVQGIYNIIEYAVVPIEEHLEKQEKFIEIKERQEKEARAALRMDELRPYEVYVPVNVNLIDMGDDEYQDLLESVKAQLQAQQEFEKAEAARKEAERLENERIRLENERLKQEAQEREAKERERRMAESKRRDAVLKAGCNLSAGKFVTEGVSMDETDVYAMSEDDFLDFVRKIAGITGQILERQLKAKEEADLRAKQEAEAMAAEQERLRKAQAEIDAAKAKALEEERQRQAEAERLAMAGDEEKLVHMIAKIESVKLSLPSVSSEKAKLIVKDVEVLLSKTVAHAKNKMK